jgi:serine/threonine protein kinase
MSILDRFTDTEIKHPSARKTVNNMPIYASRQFELPQEPSRAVLSDFGSAVRGDEKRNHDAQPTIYRSPEVMLKIEWSYPVDIWNVGVMVCSLLLYHVCAYVAKPMKNTRYGICLKVNTCFLDLTTMVRVIPPVCT